MFFLNYHSTPGLIGGNRWQEPGLFEPPRVRTGARLGKQKGASKPKQSTDQENQDSQAQSTPVEGMTGPLLEGRASVTFTFQILRY